MAKCPKCRGKGMYIVRGLAETTYECELCNGTGEVEICPTCGGTGRYIVQGLAEITYDCEDCDGTGIL